MDSANRGSLTKMIALAVVALVFIGLPWAVNWVFAPLQPSVLALTPTAYGTVAAAHSTHQAQLQRASTSVLVTQVDDMSGNSLDSDAAPTSTPAPVSFLVGGAQGSALIVFRSNLPALETTPSAQSTETAIATTPSLNAPLPTATIKLPQIFTATPPPPMAQHVELTDQQATEQLRKEVTDIEDLQVSFLQDALKLTGTVAVVGPLKVTVKVGIEINGKLILNNGKLVMQVTSIVAGGTDQTNSDQRQQVEHLIDDWLRHFLVQQKVVSYQLVPGRLIMDLLQFSEGELLTPSVTETLIPSVTPSSTASPTAGPTAVCAATPETGTPCPTAMVALPAVTQVGSNYTLPTGIAPAPVNADGSVTLTDAQATSLSGGSIGPLHDVQISFAPPSGIVISAELDVSDMTKNLIAVDLGNMLTVPITISGQLTIIDGHPHISSASLSVGHQDAVKVKGDALFEIIDSWLSALLPGQIGSLMSDNGVLTARP